MMRLIVASACRIIGVLLLIATGVIFQAAESVMHEILAAVVCSAGATFIACGALYDIGHHAEVSGRTRTTPAPPPPQPAGSSNTDVIDALKAIRAELQWQRQHKEKEMRRATANKPAGGV